MHGLVIFVAQYLLFILIAVGGIYWLTIDRNDKVRIILIGLGASLIALLLMKISSAIFYDPRPFVSSGIAPYFQHATDNGFPSDYMSLVAAPVGSSRVIAHVHSPIDIVGGLVIGIVSTYIAHWLYTLWEKRYKVSKDNTKYTS